MISLNRDLGEYSLSALYKNLIKNYLTKYYKKPININTEPVKNRPIRSAAKKLGWHEQELRAHMALVRRQEELRAMSSNKIQRIS